MVYVPVIVIIPIIKGVSQTTVLSALKEILLSPSTQFEINFFRLCGTQNSSVVNILFSFYIN